ncbi:membrane protein [Gordonia spumicola]|uniref:Membrane protein n=1 Tax=Gordonia spumicola TaxID=589161 RepID=A0A7I9V394_9ACTN|nr:thioredoxin domain-containing protein [Gordonia spumicola]GED99884.1 membrane protein [Gordonia spumicola]
MTQNRPKIVDPREAERRRSLIYKILAAVVLAVIAVVVVILVIPDKEDSATGGSATPSVVTDNGSIRITGAPKGATPKAVLTIVEDFQCPACKAYEGSMGEAIASLAKNPNVAVDYRTIAFLDTKFGNTYSAEAMNASLCVAESSGKDGDFTKWKTFHDSLFANQTEEGGPGLGSDKMIKLAKDAGVTGVTSCINDKQFGKWITKHSSDVMNSKDVDGNAFSGTPWVQLNGKTVQFSSPAELIAAVTAAAK